MNVFLKADEIINKRSEEKDRQYGPIDKSMANTATIASILCGKDITKDDIYKIMVALKLSRIGISYKEDSILDSIAYLGAYNNSKQLNIDSVAMADHLLNTYKSNIDLFCNRQFNPREFGTQRIILGDYMLGFTVGTNSVLVTYDMVIGTDLTVYDILAEHIKSLIKKIHKL